MADYGMAPGENNDTRDQDYISSIVKADQNRTEAVRNLNRQRIHDAFPAQRAAQPVSQGSQSIAPNSTTTPPMRDQ